MNSDSYYEIGAGHVFCQDYSLHGKIGETYYAIGCDGCSGSPKSEFGARLQAHIVRKLLEIHGGFIEPEILKQSVIQEMRELKTKLRLDTSNFDATLWVLTATANSYQILGWGDGMVVRKGKDGHFNVTSVVYSSGAPRYLSYALDPSRYQTYLQEFGNSDVQAVHLEKEMEPEVESHPVETFFYEEYGQLDDDIQTISVTSDGLATFQKRGDETFLPMIDFADRLTAYKSTTGLFVERRMRKVSTENQKDDIIHFDDLFCATIAL